MPHGIDRPCPVHKRGCHGESPRAPNCAEVPAKKKKLSAHQEAATKDHAAQQAWHVKENVLRGIADQVSGYKCVRWHDFHPCCGWEGSPAQPWASACGAPRLQSGVWRFSQISPRCICWTRDAMLHIYRKGISRQFVLLTCEGWLGCSLLGGWQVRALGVLWMDEREGLTS